MLDQKDLKEYFATIGKKGGEKGGKANWSGIKPSERKRRMSALAKLRWAGVSARQAKARAGKDAAIPEP